MRTQTNNQAAVTAERQQNALVA